MTIFKWLVKENILAQKLNNMGVRRATTAEQVAVADVDRKEGDLYVHTDKKTLQVYLSGTGGTFRKTELTNFIFKDQTDIGIGNTQIEVYDEEIINHVGKCNNKIFIDVRYLQYTSIASIIEAEVIDGVASPVVSTLNLESTGSPVESTYTFELDVTSLAIDKPLNIHLDLKNINLYNIEIRGN